MSLRGSSWLLRHYCPQNWPSLVPTWLFKSSLSLIPREILFWPCCTVLPTGDLSKIMEENICLSPLFIVLLLHFSLKITLTFHSDTFAIPCYATLPHVHSILAQLAWTYKQFFITCTKVDQSASFVTCRPSSKVS